MVAAILAAQCTDERVNQVTPGLFKKYPSVEAFANADYDELEAMIKSTGFFRNKTKAIIESARQIVADYDGRVPDTIDELTKLSGVGRKTANLIIGVRLRQACCDSGYARKAGGESSGAHRSRGSDQDRVRSQGNPAAGRNRPGSTT